MQADREHKKGNADLGEFEREFLVNHEARRIGTNDNACHEIANDGWQSEKARCQTAGIAKAQTKDERRDKSGVVSLHSSFDEERRAAS